MNGLLVKNTKLLILAALISAAFSTAALAQSAAANPNAGKKPTSGSDHATTHSGKPSRFGMMKELQSQGLPLPDELRSIATISDASCGYWWLTGSHNWNWNGIPGLYVSGWIFANANTFYGGPSDPESCSRSPLLVDKITVSAYTVGGLHLANSQTEYNASNVYTYMSGVGAGSQAYMCGAVASHYAEKWGVQWSAISRSGCN